jgi:hypothetical protein
MSVIITGLVIHNQGKTSIALTEADGPQTFPEELEARLVSQGVAKYVDRKPTRKEPPKESKESTPKGVATGTDERSGQDASDNIPDGGGGSDGSKNITDIPKYSADMKAAKLRELMEGCGLTYMVGMSKVDMVAALDAYFGVKKADGDENTDDADDTDDDGGPPNLGAADPVV